MLVLHVTPSIRQGAMEHGVFKYTPEDEERILGGLDGEAIFLKTSSIPELKRKYESDIKRMINLQLHMKAMHEFHKDWKLSGIQRIFYNSLVKELGSYGSEDGKFTWPTSVAITVDDDLVIKDSGNQKIQIFSPEGHHKQTFTYGSETINCLGDVVCTGEGLLLVSNGYKGIKVFSKEGEMIHLLKSSKADWKHSYGLAILNSTSIAVTDWTDGGKVHIVGVDWRMNAIMKTNVVDGLRRPEHIAVSKIPGYRRELIIAPLSIPAWNFHLVWNSCGFVERSPG
ncbi:unnamed protein product [Ranitomeya imitator]|uniref:Uncharacterized protein n=1 Tax=Ranitomeya imitator TaxID=111125 RepID=A0ABN9MF68_9NEOB|nr:unnamed protein product [Ranitomeya imitator]